jgi:hypothetical protein
VSEVTPHIFPHAGGLLDPDAEGTVILHNVGVYFPRGTALS